MFATLSKPTTGLLKALILILMKHDIWYFLNTIELANKYPNV